MYYLMIRKHLKDMANRILDKETIKALIHEVLEESFNIQTEINNYRTLDLEDKEDYKLYMYLQEQEILNRLGINE